MKAKEKNSSNKKRIRKVMNERREREREGR